MKFQIYGPQTQIRADTELEQRILNDPTTSSKLAFIQQSNEDSEYVFHLHNEDIDPEIDIKNKEGRMRIVPDGFTVYLLRVIADALQVKSGNIPLHASCINVEGINYVIIGNTKSGKSAVANILKQEYHGTIIGDDHIIFSESEVFGNQYLRMRDRINDNSYYLKNTLGVSQVNSYSIIWVDIKGVEDYKIVPASHFVETQNFSPAILKYLANSLRIGENLIPISELVGEEVQKSYYQSFQQFAHKAKEIIILGGSLDYMVNKIMRVEKK
ncbi:MAG: hypothetical protein ACMXYG_03145 [Candidatus Woesearchaeota archaeon]